MKKRLLKLLIFLVVITSIVIIVFIRALLPDTPQKAVRFVILKNGHPIIALTEDPKRLSGDDSLGYSGGKEWRYYEVRTPFDASNGWININTVAMSEPAHGSHMYRTHVVHSVD
ncbi:hypothetical protein [Levilactobacillus mulengensis]|uniref:hypothetical protein n=1 Tax=Levilactobacillus mulengensis TaxID=2486025 RepID=UPI000F77266C|nr:hypothetical protein [Levilactobacillus mulengensis]